MIHYDKRILKRRANDYRKKYLFCGNKYNKVDDYYEVECFDGQTFLISEEDLQYIIDYTWHIDKNKYVITKLSSGRVVKLHRMILGILDNSEYEVDHINRITTDNRRSNLRLSDRSLNCFNRGVSSSNSSGVTGVYPLEGKWAAQISYKGTRYYLGLFDTVDQAAIARSKAEKKFYNI